MGYGLETFNSSGVVQFSTQSATLVKFSQFTPTNNHPFMGGQHVTTSDGFFLYGWDGPNSPSPYWTGDFDIPIGYDNTKVLVFARPVLGVGSTQQIQDTLLAISAEPIAPQTNIPRRVRIYAASKVNGNMTGKWEFLIAAKPSDVTPPETSDYGLEVYDGNGTADTNLTFSSRYPLLQVQQAGTVNSYNVSTLNFDRSYIQEGTTIAGGSDYANDDPPFCLISNTEFYGEFGGGLGQNPSGNRAGRGSTGENDPFFDDGGKFTMAMVWNILPDDGSGSTWSISTGFHLREVNNDPNGNTIDYYGGTALAHDYLTVLEGN